MQIKKQNKNSLRDFIINNPQAQDRIEIKEIERQVKEMDKNFVKRDKFPSQI